MNSLLEDIKALYPKLKFKSSDSYYWSPETNEICYREDMDNDDVAKWSLLHETGHALLGHKSYDADYMLVRLEVEAWQKAKDIGKDLKIKISEDHIQDCLDTYRDWIYKRSICPKCTTKSFQQNDFRHYRCFNCHMTWRVTPSRFCRSYRVA